MTCRTNTLRVQYTWWWSACLVCEGGHVPWHQQTRLAERANSTPACPIVPSFHCIVNCTLKKKLPLALSLQGVIFLGACNWLIPKKALSAIKTSSVLFRKHMLWLLKCVIDLNYQLLIWKRNFILFFFIAIKKDTKGNSCSCLSPL